MKLLHGKAVIISAAYRPPNRNDGEYIEQLVKDITTVRSQYQSSYFILGGDFNLPDIDWESSTEKGHQLPRWVSEEFISMQQDIALEQMVLFPTRGQNTLDLLFTSHPTIIDKCKALPALGRSDHDTVLIDLALTAHQQRSSPRKILLWNKADKSIIGSHIQDATEKITRTQYTSVNDIWNDFKNAMSVIITDLVPSKISRKRPSNPWMTTDIKRLLRRRQNAFSRARHTNKTKDWARYKQLKTTVQREARKAHDQYVDNTIFGDMKNNTKQFWSYLKSKKQDSQGVTPLRKDDGFLYSDTETKAEILNDQFHSVYTREDMTSMPEKGQCPYPDMPDIHIGEAGVLKLLNNINSHKATDPDGIPARLLHEYANHIAPALTKIFQISVNRGTIPDEWRSALIVPVFKKGDRHQASNYRPVSLTSIACKLLEHIVHSQVMDQYDRHNILSDNQHGFRSKRSCETQLSVQSPLTASHVP